MPQPILESVAYLTHPNGTKIQVLTKREVLTEANEWIWVDDWDEAATAAAYAAYCQSLEAGNP